MPKESKPSQTAKRLATLAEKTEKNKREMVTELQKMPIVQVACERVGVSRAAYYKWRLDDAPFARAADRALESSKFRVNDMARSQLLRHIQAGHLTALIFWLKYNDPDFSYRRLIHEYDLRVPEKSVEEENNASHAAGEHLSWMFYKKRHTPEQLNASLEADDARDERNAEIDEEAEKYFSDTEPAT